MFQSYTYLLLLIGMLGLLISLDQTHKLAFWHDWQRTVRTLLPVLLVFVVWDLLGIHMDIFYPGDSRYTTGLLLAPGFPIEELLFLSNFCYVTLLLWLGGERYVQIHRT